MNPRPRSTLRSTSFGGIARRGAVPPAPPVARMAPGAAVERRRAEGTGAGPAAGERPRGAIARRLGFIGRPTRSPAALPRDLVGRKDRALTADALWRPGRAHDHAAEAGPHRATHVLLHRDLQERLSAGRPPTHPGPT